jgi:hypothetical protein
MNDVTSAPEITRSVPPVCGVSVLGAGVVVAGVVAGVVVPGVVVPGEVDVGGMVVEVGGTAVVVSLVLEHPVSNIPEARTATRSSSKIFFNIIGSSSLFI